MRTQPSAETTPTSVAFLGLGVMGDPMAGHLARAGHQVTVYNRTASKAHDWVRRNGGASAPTPREAAANAAFVLSCVGNDDDLRAITLGPDGAFAGMSPNSVFVDHTTTSADVARELGLAARERGLWYIDAPVSGGQAGAQHGTLTVMCGGDAQAFARTQPVISAFARAVTRLGDNGAGQLCKMVNQIAIAGVVQSLAEALAFGERAGLDLHTVLQVIGKGAAQSWQMDNRGPTMIEGRYDFGFAVDLMRKDFSLCLNEARHNGARLPVLALVDQLYADVQAAGGGRLDTSSLLTRLRDAKPR